MKHTAVIYLFFFSPASNTLPTVTLDIVIDLTDLSMILVWVLYCHNCTYSPRVGFALHQCLEVQGIPFNRKKKTLCGKDSQSLEQVAQRDYGFSYLHIQKPAGRCPEQSAVSRRVGLTHLQRSIPASIFL